MLEFLQPLKEVLSHYLLDLGGLWALVALIPLIIVYLIRPRPKKKTIPALMFLMKERSKWDKSSFLRKIIKDPLLFFQILLIILFAITLAKPFITVSQQILVEKTIIVIDVSASSQVELADGETRLTKAIEVAKENLGTKNAIITISGVPELIVDDADKSKAISALNRLESKDSNTDIFDSILFAGNYAKEKDRVVVISDFIETTSHKDYHAAKNILKSKGIFVDFIPLIDPEVKSKNVGIIDLDVNEDRTSVQIRNFNDEPVTIGLKIEGAELTTNSLDIPANAADVVNFPTPGALSKFSILPPPKDDDFRVDNDVFISAPSKEEIPLLLISNKVTKYLRAALSVIPLIDVEEGVPPKIPDIAHNIIMINNIKPDLVLPGTYKKIRKQVEGGSALIIIAQENLFDIDFQGLLPVKRASMSAPPIVSSDAYVRTTQVTSLTEDVNFGMVKKYLNAVPVDGATSLADVNEGTTMLTVKNMGKGVVVYVGLMDEYSDFKNDIFYPVFWKRLFDMVTKKQELSNLNYKTGQVVHMLKRQKIETPKGKVNEDNVILDYQGIYKSDERNFVANLLNERESDINGDMYDEMKGVYGTSMLQEKDAPFDITRYFLIGVIIFVLLELLWIKFRGDL